MFIFLCINYILRCISLACMASNDLYVWYVVMCWLMIFYFHTIVLQRTTQSVVQMGRRTRWRRCSRRLLSLPSIATPQDPNALETPWRSGSQAPCAASAMAATSKSCPASRSRREMAARALTWDHLKCRMTIWRR